MTTSTSLPPRCELCDAEPPLAETEDGDVLCVDCWLEEGHPLAAFDDAVVVDVDDDEEE